MGNSKKNFIWNLFGLSCNAFVSLFLLIIVKRINGIDNAGIFTYSFSLCCLFFILSCFFSRTFQVSDFKRKFSLNEYLSARMVFILISIVLVGIFSFISGFNNKKIYIILLLTVYKSVEAISDVFFGQMQIEGNLYKTGISYTLKSIIGLATFIIIDLFTKNLYLSIVGLFSASVIILLIYDIPALKADSIKLSLNRRVLSKLFALSLPVFIYTFLQNYLSNSQKMIMTYFISNKMQTIFSILIMPTTMILLVGNYIIMPFLNDLTAKNKEKKYDEFDRTTKKICIAVLLIGIVCVGIAYFIGIDVLNLIYGIKLNNYKSLLILMLVGAILNSIIMVLSNILTVLGENKLQTSIYFIMSVIATFLTVLLANMSKMKGLCYSYVITFVILSVIYYIVYRKKINALKK